MKLTFVLVSIVLNLGSVSFAGSSYVSPAECQKDIKDLCDIKNENPEEISACLVESFESIKNKDCRKKYEKEFQISTSCKEDIEKHCKGLKMSKKRRCIKDKQEDFSKQCLDTLNQFKKKTK